MATSATQASKNDTERSMDDVSGQVERLRDDLASLSKSVKSLGQSTGRELRGRAEDAQSEAIHAYEDTIANIRRELISMERDLNREVRKNPLQSVGIAAGIGFALALILNR